MTVNFELADNSPQPPPGLAPSPWYAIWTKSHSEQLVADQLMAKGFDVFLPKIKVWSRRGGARHVIDVPMFSSYLFLHDAVDKHKYIEVLKARGVVRILGDRWDRLSPVSHSEIDALQQVLAARLSVEPYPYLHVGQRVRITVGPLRGLEGLLVQQKLKKGLLVLSVELLRRSVGVVVDCSWVDPI